MIDTGSEITEGVKKIYPLKFLKIFFYSRKKNILLLFDDVWSIFSLKRDFILRLNFISFHFQVRWFLEPDHNLIGSAETRETYYKGTLFYKYSVLNVKVYCES